MKLIFAAACLVGAFALSTSPSPEAAQPVTTASVSPQLVEEAEPLAFCPFRWTCDTTSTYYALRADCERACGVGACYREPYCQPGCVCP